MFTSFFKEKYTPLWVKRNEILSVTWQDEKCPSIEHITSIAPRPLLSLDALALKKKKKRNCPSSLFLCLDLLWTFIRSWRMIKPRGNSQFQRNLFQERPISFWGCERVEFETHRELSTPSTGYKKKRPPEKDETQRKKNIIKSEKQLRHGTRKKKWWIGMVNKRTTQQTIERDCSWPKWRKSWRAGFFLVKCTKSTLGPACFRSSSSATRKLRRLTTLP